MRRLLVIHRLLPSIEALGACSDAWRRTVAAVEAAGGRAWRFRDPASEHLLVEFIEWTDPADPLCNDEVNAALSALSEIAPSTSQLLEEA